MSRTCSAPFLCRALIALALAAVLAVTVPAIAMAAVAAEGVTPAVVAVMLGQESVGSGVVVADGYVLTADHVMRSALRGRSSLLIDGERRTFEVVERDPTRDLALLSADTRGAEPVRWGDSAALSRGDEVVALGFPIGLRSVSFTKGVVSSPSQRVYGRDYLQTDAAINPGNSGGPLLDRAGRLVGINVAKVADPAVEGLGLAVPSAEALRFVQTYAPGADLSVPVTPTSRTLSIVVLGLGALAVAVFTAAYFWLSRRERDRHAAAQPDVPAVARKPRKRSFHMVSAARDEVVHTLLPAVVGTAPDADIRIDDHGIGAYQLRISERADGSVTVLDLTDSEGLYCANACVAQAVIAPGESFSAGSVTFTLVERRK